MTKGICSISLFPLVAEERGDRRVDKAKPPSTTPPRQAVDGAALIHPTHWLRGLLLAVVLATPAWADPGTLLRDEALRREPGADAPVLRRVYRGERVELGERQGGWLRATAAGHAGWLRLLSVRPDPRSDVLGEAKGMLSTGSAGRDHQRVVAVAGFRGEEEARIDPAGDAALLHQLDAYCVNSDTARAFAATGGLRPQRLDYLSLTDGQGVGAARQSRMSLLSGLLLGRLGAEDEARIGARMVRNLLSATPLATDAGLQDYVNRIGRWLAEQGEQAELHWRFAVFDSDELVSLSAPGGFVLLSSGLYRQLDNEAELAAVLGREMAHVLRRDALPPLRQQARDLGSAILGGGSPDSEEVMQRLLGDGPDAILRPLGEEAVSAADRQGLILAARAGYDLYALPAVLHKLARLSPDDPRFALPNRLWPPPAERMDRLTSALNGREADLPAGQSAAARFYRLPLAER